MKRVYWLLVFSPALVAACGWNPKKPFERESPQVRNAIGELDAGQPKAAGTTLEDYLVTGACRQGAIGTPPRLKERPNAAYDLGLAFFKVAEAMGKRFGDEDDKTGELDPNAKSLRGETVECALAVVRAIASDPSQSPDLRARAHFVEGNLLFLNANYDDAIKAYDQALEAAPGMHPTGPSGAPDSGKPWNPDQVGRDAAWNRSVALRRQEDNKDAGPDASPDGGDGGDGGESGDGGQDQDPDGGSQQGDAGPRPQENQPPPKPSQEERLLDQLENAPTVQQEAAKEAAKRQPRQRLPRMLDK